MHSRYIEAAVDGVLIGCLYLPNGNPAPGPKFDYKLRWFERLAGRRIAIGQVQATDQDPIDRRLDIPAVRIIQIARESAACLHRRSAARQYGDTVPALLALPDCAITGFPDRRLREFLVWCFELLQADDVLLGFGEPAAAPEGGR